MKLKLEENLPHDLAAALRGEGHDVHTVDDEPPPARVTR